MNVIAFRVRMNVEKIKISVSHLDNFYSVPDTDL